jgi:hypothetical protein
MANTLADWQMQKLPALVGFTASVEDMLRAYYKLNAEPAVAVIPNLSIRDYERSMYINFTGVSPLNSISDLERRFYTVTLAGDDTMSLADREYEYWSER